MMTLRVLIDQHTANEVMKRDGPEGFDRWWAALGVLVRMTWPGDTHHAGKRGKDAEAAVLLPQRFSEKPRPPMVTSVRRHARKFTG